MVGQKFRVGQHWPTTNFRPVGTGWITGIYPRCFLGFYVLSYANSSFYPRCFFGLLRNKSWEFIILSPVHSETFRRAWVSTDIGSDDPGALRVGVCPELVIFFKRGITKCEQTADFRCMRLHFYWNFGSNNLKEQNNFNK